MCGDVVAARSRVDGWRARSEAGFWSLAALGTHGLDLITWPTGAAITDVVAITEPRAGVASAAIDGRARAGGAARARRYYHQPNSRPSCCPAPKIEPRP